MADTKTTALTELAEAPASGDLFMLVDVSDTTMDAAGTNKKISATNAIGNAIAKSFVDAKGDLISASADNTPARLAVGTNDMVLTAASGETTGLVWRERGAVLADATTGWRSVIPGFFSYNGSDNGFTAANGVTYYFGPMWVDAPLTVDAIACKVDGGVTATHLLRVALISVTRSTLQPASALETPAELSLTTTGFKTFTFTSRTLTPGHYFLSLRTDSPLQFIMRRGQWAAGYRATQSDLMFGSFDYLQKTEAYGAYSATPTAWDTIVNTGQYINNSRCPLTLRLA